jgi:nuclease S1
MNTAIRPRWKRIFGAAFAIALALPAASLFAWGDDGHEITGVIAYAHLASAVKKNVDALLAADRDTLTAADFVSRTVWADKYRDSDRQTTKKRYEGTREWHFVDIELSDGNVESACHRYPTVSSGQFASAGPAKACVIDKIGQFAAELRSSATPKSEKVLALKFLLHFVGDLHQPLHAADNRDRGGNDVAIIYGNHTTPDNLHSYWDRELVERLGSDPRTIGAALNRQISSAKAEQWSKGTFSAWARESFQQAKTVVYNFTGKREFNAERGSKIQRLDTAYEQRALPAVREQLSKAGVRIAAVLNNALR